MEALEKRHRYDSLPLLLGRARPLSLSREMLADVAPELGNVDAPNAAGLWFCSEIGGVASRFFISSRCIRLHNITGKIKHGRVSK